MAARPLALTGRNSGPGRTARGRFGSAGFKVPGLSQWRCPWAAESTILKFTSKTILEVPIREPGKTATEATRAGETVLREYVELEVGTES